jgi:hypothetical protein
LDGQYSATGQLTVNVRDKDEIPSITTSTLYVGQTALVNPYTGQVVGIENETTFTFSITDPDHSQNFAGPYKVTYNNSQGYGTEIEGQSYAWQSIVPTTRGTEYPGPAYVPWPTPYQVDNGGQYLIYGYFPHVKTTLFAQDSGGAIGRADVDLRAPNYSGAPIVLDLDGDGIELTNWRDAPIRFDMNADGRSDLTGWVAPDDALLAIDLNSNGQIDDGSEVVFQPKLDGALSDLEGLRLYDSNANGFIDAGDAQFDAFRVWQDANQNGISDAGELRTLTEAGIAEINLTLSPTGAVWSEDDIDNVVYSSSQYVKTDGSTGAVGDVFLSYMAENETNFVYGSHASVIGIDLDGGGVAIEDLANSQTAFDMNGDGATEATGWIGAGDALLVADIDANGVIDSGEELAAGGQGFGLARLAALDTNHDGKLDADDASFASLRLWQDINQDGVSQSGELSTLAAAGIRAIDLPSATDPFVLGQGESRTYDSFTIEFEDGSTKQGGETVLAFSPPVITQASQLTQAMAAFVPVSGDDGMTPAPQPTNDVYHLAASAA